MALFGGLLGFDSGTEAGGIRRVEPGLPDPLDQPHAPVGPCEGCLGKAGWV